VEGVKERIEIEEVTSRPQSAVPISRQAIPSSRRRRGPAFLPSEHDELPPGMAFMTIAEVAPVVALDFSEPYGTLVSASSDEASPRVWDLLSGEQLGQLRGHTRGGVKCLQVEDTLCLTGGVDGAVRLWDLRRVGMEEDEIEPGWDLAEEKSEFGEFGEFGETRSSRSEVSAGSDANGHGSKKESTCIRVLEGHSRPVTALYFEDNCLVCINRSRGVSEVVTDFTYRSLERRIRHCVNGT
jgi:division protein 1